MVFLTSSSNSSLLISPGNFCGIGLGFTGAFLVVFAGGADGLFVCSHLPWFMGGGGGTGIGDLRGGVGECLGGGGIGVGDLRGGVGERLGGGGTGVGDLRGGVGECLGGRGTGVGDLRGGVGERLEGGGSGGGDRLGDGGDAAMSSTPS